MKNLQEKETMKKYEESTKKRTMIMMNKKNKKKTNSIKKRDIYMLIKKRKLDNDFCCCILFNDKNLLTFFVIKYETLLNCFNCSVFHNSYLNYEELVPMLMLEKKKICHLVIN